MSSATHRFIWIRFYAIETIPGERLAASDKPSAAVERGSVEPPWQDG